MAKLSRAKLEGKYVVDTNVPKTANLALDSAAIPDDLVDCVLACVEIIEQIVVKGGMVIDGGDEIFDEYRQQLSRAGQPGVGDHFMKWVHDNRWSLPETDRVIITKNGESYDEFPEHADKVYLVSEFAADDDLRGRDVSDPFGQGRAAYDETLSSLGKILPSLLAYIDKTWKAPAS